MSSPPEKAIPTRSPTGSDISTLRHEPKLPGAVGWPVIAVGPRAIRTGQGCQRHAPPPRPRSLPRPTPGRNTRPMSTAPVATISRRRRRARTTARVPHVVDRRQHHQHAGHEWQHLDQARVGLARAARATTSTGRAGRWRRHTEPDRQRARPASRPVITPRQPAVSSPATGCPGARPGGAAPVVGRLTSAEPTGVATPTRLPAPATLPAVAARTDRDTFKKLSVFYPMWNEEDYIERALRFGKAACEDLVESGDIADYELIVIDDKSTDRTPETGRRDGRRRSARPRHPSRAQPQAGRLDEDRVRRRHRRPRALHRRRPAVRHGRAAARRAAAARVRRRHHLGLPVRPHRRGVAAVGLHVRLQHA